MSDNDAGDRISQQATASDQGRINQVGGDQYNTVIVWRPGGGTAPAPRTLSTWEEERGGTPPGRPTFAAGAPLSPSRLRIFIDAECAPRLRLCGPCGPHRYRRLGLGRSLCQFPLTASS
jgi:hypothetical protein